MARWSNRARQTLRRELEQLAEEHRRAFGKIGRLFEGAEEQRRRASQDSLREAEEVEEVRRHPAETSQSDCRSDEKSSRRHFELLLRAFDRSDEALRQPVEEIRPPPRRRKRRRRRRGDGLDLAPTPVEPSNPKGLSGGAEAPLEFDH
jgi:hypothetical protein